ncbi:MAG: hypothetical protein SFX18_14895 [Pirellulales bacterium]|nr:hypothetical protein [Pirellulales bacterium]
MKALRGGFEAGCEITPQNLHFFGRYFSTFMPYALKIISGNGLFEICEKNKNFAEFRRFAGRKLVFTPFCVRILTDRLQTGIDHQAVESLKAWLIKSGLIADIVKAVV